MADLQQSLIAKKQEEQKRMKTLIQNKTEETDEIITSTRRDAESGFEARDRTLVEFDREMKRQVQQREQFEKSVMDQFSHIPVNIAPELSVSDTRLFSHLQTQYQENLAAIKRESNSLELSGQTITLNSATLMESQYRLKQEQQELQRVEGELTASVQKLQARLEEIGRDMEASLAMRRDKIQSALQGLAGDVEARVNNLHLVMAHSEEEVKKVLEMMSCSTS